jgi:hypothetical protein
MCTGSDEYTPQDSIEFKLKVTCTKNPNPKDDSEEEKYTNCKGNIIFTKMIIVEIELTAPFSTFKRFGVGTP